MIFHENGIGAKLPLNKTATSFCGFTILGDVLIEIKHENLVKLTDEFLCKITALNNAINEYSKLHSIKDKKTNVERLQDIINRN